MKPIIMNAYKQTQCLLSVDEDEFEILFNSTVNPRYNDSNRSQRFCLLNEYEFAVVKNP